MPHCSPAGRSPAGEIIYTEPYSDELRVQDITWNTDPEDDEPAVALSDIDFDVIGDDDEALEAFPTAGWTAER